MYSSILSLTSMLDGVDVNATPRPLYTRESDPVPIVWEAGWAPGPVWTGEENLAPTGILPPDRPGRSESLYRLHYPCPVSENYPSQIHRPLGRQEFAHSL
jgi:hypothetical protein